MPLGRDTQKADGQGNFLQEATCPQHPLLLLQSRSPCEKKSWVLRRAR